MSQLKRVIKYWLPVLFCHLVKLPYHILKSNHHPLVTLHFSLCIILYKWQIQYIINFLPRNTSSCLESCDCPFSVPLKLKVTMNILHLSFTHPHFYRYITLTSHGQYTDSTTLSWCQHNLPPWCHSKPSYLSQSLSLIMLTYLGTDSATTCWCWYPNNLSPWCHSTPS